MKDLTNQLTLQNNLSSLHFSNINLDDRETVENICEIQTLRYLHELDLSWCQLRSKYLWKISNMLSKKLRKLNLSYNNINTKVYGEKKNKDKKKVVEE